MRLTSTQTRVARAIVSYARRENLAPDSHLPESHLATLVGTSRFPVHAALSHLAELGVVRHDRDRGFFLAVPAHSLSSLAKAWSTADEDPVYLRIADLRLRGRLPDAFTESDLIRQLHVSRNALRKSLFRIQQQGWVERRAGHGWSFLPMIDSVEAYEESYAFRLVIEPAGILSPMFRADLPALAACRKQQEFIAGEGYRTMTPIELFEANARFHEAIAMSSGNRFILQTVRRLDQLRRLVEYRQAKQRLPRKKQAEEHLAILDSITQGDLLSAATKMRAHLDGARRAKVSSSLFNTRKSK
jgi:DNA-binding GntR family transcriptional regulator